MIFTKYKPSSFAKGILYLLAFLLATFIINSLSSCKKQQLTRCERKLARVMKRCPELLDTSRLLVKIDTTLPGFLLADSTPIGLDTGKVNSILDSFAVELMEVESTSHPLRKDVVLKKYRNRFQQPGICELVKGIIYVDTLGVNLAIWQRGNTLFYKLQQSPRRIKAEKSVQKFKEVKIPEEKRLLKAIIILALILLILVVLRKIFA